MRTRKLSHLKKSSAAALSSQNNKVPTHLAWVTRSILAGSLTYCRRLLHSEPEHRLAGAFCLDCWRMTNPLFKGLRARLKTSGIQAINCRCGGDAIHFQGNCRWSLIGIKGCVCVTWAMKCNAHWLWKEEKFPVLFWHSSSNTFNHEWPELDVETV